MPRSKHRKKHKLFKKKMRIKKIELKQMMKRKLANEILDKLYNMQNNNPNIEKNNT